MVGNKELTTTNSIGWFQEQRMGKKMFSEVVTREEVGG